MSSAAAFLFSWRHAKERAILTAALKGGPFRSKYLESSWIWRQNDLTISKRKVRATYWCKNPTDYVNKIRRYLRRKIGNREKVSLPFLSLLEQGSLLPDSGRACSRVHAPSLGHIGTKESGKYLLWKWGREFAWQEKTSSELILWPESSKEVMKCKIFFSTLFYWFCSLIIVSQ